MVEFGFFFLWSTEKDFRVTVTKDHSALCNCWPLTPAEFDALVRLGIPDPSSYIKKRFKSNKLLFLRAACVGQALVDQVEASVEEAVNSATWADIQVEVNCYLLNISNDRLNLFISDISCCHFFFVIFLLAALANPAQLPVSGGCWDVDQPGYEEH